jgi:hypothetical protein
VSARYGEVEATLCLLVGCLLVPVVLYFQGSPVILQAVHSIWG